MPANKFDALNKDNHVTNIHATLAGRRERLNLIVQLNSQPECLDTLAACPQQEYQDNPTAYMQIIQKT